MAKVFLDTPSRKVSISDVTGNDNPNITTQPQENTTNTKRGTVQLDSIQNAGRGRSVVYPGSTNEYDRAVGEGKYHPELGSNVNAMRMHEAQSVGKMALNFATQFATSVVGGAVEGVGYMFDLSAGADLADNSRILFGNAVSRLGANIQTAGQTIAPIHMDPYKEGKFDPGSASWWLSNATSIASSLSLLLPILGVTALTKNAAPAIQAISSSFITRAALSRQMEGLMEARGQYDETFEKYKNLGYSFNEAKEAAAIGAANSYNKNWLLLAQDLPQFKLFSKLLKLKGSPADWAQQKALNTWFGKSNAPLNTAIATHTLGDMLGEGGEESFQFSINKQSTALAENAIYGGKAKNTRLGEAVLDSFGDGEMWTSAFFGALGAGVMQTGMTSLGAKALRREVDNSLAPIKNLSAVIKQSNELVDAAIESDDYVDKQRAYIYGMVNMAMVGNKLGITGDQGAMFDALFTSTDKDDLALMEKIGIAPEELKKFRENTANKDSFLAEFKAINTIADTAYEANKKKIGKTFKDDAEAKANALETSYYTYLTQKMNSLVEATGTAMDEKFKTSLKSIVNENQEMIVSETAVHKMFANTKRFHYNARLEALEKQLADPKTTEKEKMFLNKQKEYVTKGIATIDEEIKKLDEGYDNEEDIILSDGVTKISARKHDEDLMKGIPDEEFREGISLVNRIEGLKEVVNDLAARQKAAEEGILSRDMRDPIKPIEKPLEDEPGLGDEDDARSLDIGDTIKHAGEDYRILAVLDEDGVQLDNITSNAIGEYSDNGVHFLIEKVNKAEGSTNEDNRTVINAADITSDLIVSHKLSSEKKPNYNLATDEISTSDNSAQDQLAKTININTDVGSGSNPAMHVQYVHAEKGTGLLRANKGAEEFAKVVSNKRTNMGNATSRLFLTEATGMAVYRDIMGLLDLEQYAEIKKNLTKEQLVLLQKYYRDGTPLTKAEVDTLFGIPKKGGLAALDYQAQHLVDILPIRTGITINNKEYKDGLYLPATPKADEIASGNVKAGKNASIATAIAMQRRQKRLSSRELRYNIFSELLTGTDSLIPVYDRTKKIQRGRGSIRVIKKDAAGRNRSLVNVFGEKVYNWTFGISRPSKTDEGVITVHKDRVNDTGTDGVSVAEVSGFGSVYIYVPASETLNTNGRSALVKLNKTKVSRGIAEMVFDAYSILAKNKLDQQMKGKKTKSAYNMNFEGTDNRIVYTNQSAVKDNNRKQLLSIGQFLETFVVHSSRRTGDTAKGLLNKYGTKPDLFMQAANRYLHYVVKNEDVNGKTVTMAQLEYGVASDDVTKKPLVQTNEAGKIVDFTPNTIVLYTSAGQQFISKEAKEHFIEWMTLNKNYAVHLESKQSGVKLNSDEAFLDGLGFEIYSNEHKPDDTTVRRLEIQYDGKSSYRKFLIDNKFVSSDALNAYDETGTESKEIGIFEYPIVDLNFATASAKLAKHTATRRTANPIEELKADIGKPATQTEAKAAPTTTETPRVEQSVTPKEAIAKPVSRPTSKAYFSIPDLDGSFAATNSTATDDGRRHFYIEVDESGTEGKLFYLAGERDKRAINRLEAYLRPVSTIENFENAADATRIEVVQPGRVTLSNGKWVIDPNNKLRVKLLRPGEATTPITEQPVAKPAESVKTETDTESVPGGVLESLQYIKDLKERIATGNRKDYSDDFLFENEEQEIEFQEDWLKRHGYTYTEAQPSAKEEVTGEISTKTNEKVIAKGKTKADRPTFIDPDAAPYADIAEQKETPTLEHTIDWAFEKVGIPKSEWDIRTRLEDLVYQGRDNFALYSHDAIKIWYAADPDIVYHESFHRVSLGYLTQEEQASLLRAARIKYSMPKDSTTDKDVWEKLADEFMDFMRVRGAEMKPANRIERFFDKIKQFIKRLFIGKNKLSEYDIDLLFKNIAKGKYAKSKVLAENIGNLKPGEYQKTMAGKHIISNLRSNNEFNDFLGMLVAQLFKLSGVTSVEQASNLDIGKLVAFIEGGIDENGEAWGFLATEQAIFNNTKNSKADREDAARNIALYQEILGEPSYLYGQTAPEGFVRLYRSETEKGATKPTPEWVQSHPEAQASFEAEGRWFYKTQAEALAHAEKFGSSGITFIDVPAEDVEKYNARNNKFAGGYGKDGNEYFVTQELADSRVSHEKTKIHTYPKFKEVIEPQILNYLKGIGISKASRVQASTKEDYTFDDYVNDLDYEENRDNLLATSGKTNTVYNKLPFQFSRNESVRANVKYMVKTLYQYDTDGNPVVRSFGGPAFVNFTETWHIIINKLYKAKSIEEMILLLHQLAADKRNKAYSQLAERLEKSRSETKSQFFVAIRAAKRNFMAVEANKPKDRSAYNVNVDDVSETTAKFSLLHTWFDNFITDQDLFANNRVKADGNFGTSAAQEFYVNEVQALMNFYSKNTDMLTSYEVDQMIDGYINYLNRYHIEIDRATVEYIINRGLAEDKNQDLPEAVRRMVALRLHVKEVAAIFAVINVRAVDKTAVKKRDLKFARNKVLINLATDHLAAHPDLLEDSQLGPNGNLYYTISATSHTTDTFLDLTEDTALADQLKESAGFKRSRLLRHITANQEADEATEQARVKSAREGLKLRTFSYLRVPSTQGKDEGRDYFKTTPTEDFIYQYGMYLNKNRDGVSNPILALPSSPRSSAFFIEGLPVFIDPIKGVLHKEGTIEVEYEFSDEVLEYFRGAYLDEVDRVNNAWTLIKEYLEANDERRRVLRHSLVLNQHVTIKSDGTLNFSSANGLRLQHFAGVQNMPKDFPTKLLGKYKDTYLEPISEKEFNTKIGKILSGHINETVEEALANGVLVGADLMENKVLYPVNAQLPDTRIKKLNNDFGQDVGTKVAIGEFAINSAMAILETSNVLGMHPSLFKYDAKAENSFADFYKRMYGPGSSGDHYRETTERDDKTTYSAMVINTQSFAAQALLDMYIPWHTTMIKQQLAAAYNESLAEKKFQLEKYSDNNVELGRIRADIADLEAKLKPEALNKVAEAEARTRLNAFGKVDPTDGGSWISVDMFKKLLDREGSLTAELEAAIDYVEAGDFSDVALYNKHASAVAYMPQKTMYFGISFENGGAVLTYDKMSMGVLFKSLAQETGLMDLYDRMNATGKYEGLNKIDQAIFDSAIKTGGRIGLNYFVDGAKMDVTHDLSDAHAFPRQWVNLRKQQKLDAHDSYTNQSLGSAVFKIAGSNLNRRGIYTDASGMLSDMTGDELSNSLHESRAAISDIGVHEVSAKFGYKDGKTDKKVMLRTLALASIAAGKDADYIDSFETDEVGGLKVHMDAMPDRGFIYARINKIIKKATVDLNTPGAQLVQLSSWGLTKQVGETRLKMQQIRDEEGNTYMMECAVSTRVFQHLIPNYNNISHEERVKILESIKPTLIGYRTPTQGQNSVMSLTVTKYLRHQSADTIFLPLEFTALTGSDFDIDKLFVAFKEFDVDAATGKATVVKFTTGTDPQSIQERYRAKVNEMWHIYKADSSRISDETYDRITALQRKAKYGAKVDNLDEVVNGFAGSEEAQASVYSLYTEYKLTEAKINAGEIDKQDGKAELRAIQSMIEEYLPRVKDSKREDELYKAKLEALTQVGVMPTVDAFSKLNIAAQNTRAANVNRILTMYDMVLTSKHHLTSTTRPLDSAKAPLKSFAEKSAIASNGGEVMKMSALQGLFPNYQASVKYNNKSAESLVGPVALANAFHSVTQAAKTSFKTNFDYGHNSKGGYIRWDRVYGFDFVPITEWISALIDASVDLQKDDYILKLNVNDATMSVVELLIKVGFGLDTFHYMAQPIVKEFARRYAIRKGRISSNITEDGADDFDQRTAEVILAELVKDTIRGNGLDSNEEGTTLATDKQESFTSLMGYYANEENALYDMNPKNASDPDVMYRQVNLAIQLGYLVKDAEILTDLTLLARVDTSQGVYTPSQKAHYRMKVEKLKEIRDANGKPRIKGLDKIINMSKSNFEKGDTCLPVLFNNSFKLGTRLLNDVSIQNSEGFDKLFNAFIRQLPLFNKKHLSLSKVHDVEEEMFAYFTGLYYGIQEGPFADVRMTTAKYQELFVRGDNTLFNQLDDLKQMIATQYPELLENRFLLLFQAEMREKSPIREYLRVPSRTITDANDVLDYKVDYNTLLTHEDAMVRQFASLAKLYLYYSTGGRNKIRSYAKYMSTLSALSVPYVVETEVDGQIVETETTIRSSEYFKDLNAKLNGSSENSTGAPVDVITTYMNDMARTVLQNNWWNKHMVRRLDKSAQNFEELSMNGELAGIKLTKSASDPLVYGYNKEGRPLFERFVTIPNAAAYESWELILQEEGYDVFSERDVSVMNNELNGLALFEFIGLDSETGLPIYIPVNKHSYSYTGQELHEMGVHKPDGKSAIPGNNLVSQLTKEQRIEGINEALQNKHGVIVYDVPDFAVSTRVKARRSEEVEQALRAAFAKKVDNSSIEQVFVNGVQATSLYDFIASELKKYEYKGLVKVISGGQLGADMAGLDAALEAGYEIGGTASAGYVQSVSEKNNVQNLELQTKYGLAEGESRKVRGKFGEFDDKYHMRTIKNAQDADGTVWFGNPKSPGGKLTLGSEAQKGKAKPLINPTSAKEIVDWMVANKISTLNVAGNREWTNPGIYENTKAILTEALKAMKSRLVSAESTETPIADYEEFILSLDFREELEKKLLDAADTMSEVARSVEMGIAPVIDSGLRLISDMNQLTMLDVPYVQMTREIAGKGNTSYFIYVSPEVRNDDGFKESQFYALAKDRIFSYSSELRRKLIGFYDNKLNILTDNKAVVDMIKDAMQAQLDYEKTLKTKLDAAQPEYIEPSQNTAGTLSSASKPLNVYIYESNATSMQQGASSVVYVNEESEDQGAYGHTTYRESALRSLGKSNKYLAKLPAKRNSATQASNEPINAFTLLEIDHVLGAFAETGETIAIRITDPTLFNIPRLSKLARKNMLNADEKSETAANGTLISMKPYPQLTKVIDGIMGKVAKIQANGGDVILMLSRVETVTPKAYLDSYDKVYAKAKGLSVSGELIHGNKYEFNNQFLYPESDTDMMLYMRAMGTFEGEEYISGDYSKLKKDYNVVEKGSNEIPTPDDATLKEADDINDTCNI